MRLIDADELINNLGFLYKNRFPINSIARQVLTTIMEQPTAYDIDKVVEELEKLKAEKEMGTSKVVVKECIEIVKQQVKE